MSALLARANAAVDWISAGYRPDPRGLAVLRIAFAIYVLVWSRDISWLRDVSPVAFDPPLGPFALLPGPPSVHVVMVLEVLRAALALFVLVGYRTRITSALLTFVMIVCDGLAYSYGKVDHTILYLLAPLMLGLAGWGSAWSVDARRRAHPVSGYAMFVYATLIAFAMFTAAAAKAATGWLWPTREAARYYVAADADSLTRPGLLARAFLHVDGALLWKLVDYATLLTEGWLVLAVFFPGLFRTGLLMLSMFHVGIWLLLAIDFHIHAFVYLGFLLVPLSRWFPEIPVVREWLARHRSGSSGRLRRDSMVAQAPPEVT